MASIPLPALSIRTPEPPDLLQKYAQVQQIKNAGLQSTALAQENQMRSQQIKDQQAMTAAMHQWDGKDFESLIPLASKNGASATAVMGLKQKNLEIKDKYSQIAKNDAETGEKNLATLKGRNDIVAGGINSVLDAPDEELSQRLLATAQDLQQKGVLDPQHLQMAQQMAQADPKTLRSQLGIFKKSFQADSQQMEEAQKAATAARENADARKTNLEANQMEQSGAMSPMVADSKYRMIQQKLIQKQPVTPDEAAWAKSYEKQKELNTQVRVNAMGQQREYPVYDTQSKTTLMLTPDAINQANRDTPGRYTVPGFTTEAQIQKKTGEAFAPGGKAGEEVLAFNTSLAHADLLQKAATALKNNDTRTLNSLKNSFKTAFGSADVTNYQTIANAYTREVTKALSAGHLTDSEIAQQGATLPSNASPDQMLGTIGAYKSLMQSKVDLRKQQLEAGKQGKSSIELSPAVGPSATGPNGHKIVVKDGKWVDAETGKPLQ